MEMIAEMGNTKITKRGQKYERKVGCRDITNVMNITYVDLHLQHFTLTCVTDEIVNTF